MDVIRYRELLTLRYIDKNVGSDVLTLEMEEIYIRLDYRVMQEVREKRRARFLQEHPNMKKFMQVMDDG